MAALSLPRSWRRSSLRLRVIAAILAVAIAPQLLVFAWTQVDRHLSNQLWGAVQATARETATAAAAAKDEASLNTAIAELEASTRLSIRVLDEDGNELAYVKADDDVSTFDRVEAFFLGGPTPPSPERLATMLGAPRNRFIVWGALVDAPNVDCDFYDGLLVCQSAMKLGHVAAGPRAPAMVLVEGHARRAVQVAYGLRHQLLRLALVTLPLAAILAWYVGRRVVRPLDQLRDEALRQSSRATRNVGLSTKHADEVGDLAVAFNELLAALEAKRRDNEAFVADLVHELKSPVAAVRAASESVQPELPADRAARIARVLGDSAGKMDRLVTQFLELARAEAEGRDDDRQLIALGPLLEGIVGIARDDERNAGKRVTFDANDASAVRVRGIDHRLEGTFRELVENAASFATSEVRVALGIDGRFARVTIDDDGPGIAPDDLPRVFDRFFTTRGRRHGTGLGLALVRAVVETHGGQVTAETRAGGGARFLVKLPLARD